MEQINLDTDSDSEGHAIAIESADVEDGELDEIPIILGDTPTQRLPIFEIKFPQRENFKKFGYKVLNTLQDAFNNTKDEALEFYTAAGDGEGNGIIRAFVPVVSATSESVMEISSPAASIDDKRCSREQSPDLSADLSALFTIDPLPAEKLDTVKVPSYKRTIKDVLDDESSERKKKNDDDPDKCNRPRPSTSCFNCGSNDHVIRDCSRPRNMKRINRAKKARSKNERYHVDIEQRFAHLRPGVISETLQNALGLRRGELPFFFYRMRLFGYPPGWLEEAKVAHSGMTLFNSDGTAVLQSDESEGDDKTMSHKIDVKKIVDFPGFNVDPGKNFYDDYKHHNVPPMSSQIMKDEFIKMLGDNVIKGYKRKKLKNLPTPKSAEEECKNIATTLEEFVMEIEDSDAISESNVIFTRPLPPPDEEAPPPPLPPETPPPQIPAGEDEDDESSESLTLAELEAHQQKLLRELQANTSNMTDDSLIDDVLELDNTQSDLNKSAAHSNTSVSTSAPPTPSTPLPMDAKRNTDIIKESHMGTPLLKFSPFDKLPAGDNFKVGVSDVINFENLPDSTGKYEQMKVVIKKVRNLITKLNDEDD